MKTVNQSMRKKDAMQLVTGQPVYMDDVIPQDCLIVKLLRSPHANAIVQEIDTSRALLVPGIEAIYTWEDVDQQGRRYTQAGQTYPEPSPYDRLVIDRHVRFAGDVVAILAGKDETCVDKAMKLVKVEYDVLEPVLDFRTALDNPVLVHPEENWETQCPVGADNRRNLCAHEEDGQGDIDAVLRSCDIVIDRVYHTKACQQTPMETFRTFCTIDAYGRLHIVSSTQIVFHTRRIVANALHIPRSKIRVSKPRVGGGFGAKQTAVSAVYPAFVTWMTKKPSMIVFSRRESMIAGSPRHEMEMHVRLGADKNGVVRAITDDNKQDRHLGVITFTNVDGEWKSEIRSFPNPKALQTPCRYYRSENSGYELFLSKGRSSEGNANEDTYYLTLYNETLGTGSDAYAIRLPVDGSGQAEPMEIGEYLSAVAQKTIEQPYILQVTPSPDGYSALILATYDLSVVCCILDLDTLICSRVEFPAQPDLISTIQSFTTLSWLEDGTIMIPSSGTGNIFKLSIE